MHVLVAGRDSKRNPLQFPEEKHATNPTWKQDVPQAIAREASTMRLVSPQAQAKSTKDRPSSPSQEVCFVGSVWGSSALSITGFGVSLSLIVPIRINPSPIARV